MEEGGGGSIWSDAMSALDSECACSPRLSSSTVQSSAIRLQFTSAFNVKVEVGLQHKRREHLHVEGLQAKGEQQQKWSHRSTTGG